MKSKAMTVLATMLLATAAVAQSPTASTTPGAVPHVNVSTAEFVKKVAISDMFEIESSRLALTKYLIPIRSRLPKGWFKTIRRRALS